MVTKVKKEPSVRELLSRITTLLKEVSMRKENFMDLVSKGPLNSIIMSLDAIIKGKKMDIF
jgi:hypothetical protein